MYEFYVTPNYQFEEIDPYTFHRYRQLNKGNVAIAKLHMAEWKLTVFVHPFEEKAFLLCESKTASEIGYISIAPELALGELHALEYYLVGFANEYISDKNQCIHSNVIEATLNPAYEMEPHYAVQLIQFNILEKSLDGFQFQVQYTVLSHGKQLRIFLYREPLTESQNSAALELCLSVIQEFSEITSME